MTERFEPGADYGRGFDHVVMVCINPQVRNFEQCNIEAGVAVLQACRNAVQALNLSGSTFVTTSGCVLGCKPKGTTVTLISKKSKLADGCQVVYLRDVLPQDVTELFKTYLLDKEITAAQWKEPS